MLPSMDQPMPCTRSMYSGVCSWVQQDWMCRWVLHQILNMIDMFCQVLSGTCGFGAFALFLTLHSLRRCNKLRQGHVESVLGSLLVGTLFRCCPYTMQVLPASRLCHRRDLQVCPAFLIGCRRSGGLFGSCYPCSLYVIPFSPTLCYCRGFATPDRADRKHSCPARSESRHAMQAYAKL